MRRALITLVGCVLAAATLVAASYSSAFPLTENPINESGHWAGGQSAGGNLWGDVQTNGTMAFGVSEPTGFGDPTAVLTGSWGPTQTVQGTVKVVNTPASGGCCHEVEVRLRNTISASSISGYEAYCSIVPQAGYCHIAGWGGANGTFKNLDECAGISDSTTLVNGDVLKATASGSNPTTVTLYVNNVQKLQIVDNGNIGGNCLYNGDNAHHGPYTSGNPGLGFFIGGASDWSSWGISSFTATDGTSGPARIHTFRIGL